MNKPGEIIRVKDMGEVIFAPPPDPIATFAEAFVKLQAAIRPAIKDSTNPAFRSKYADLGAVWDAVKAPLTENGFSIIQSPDFDGETMWLKTIILHTSGERIEGRYPLRPKTQDPQGYGSALTYARRYSISAMLGVIADEDDDGNAASGYEKGNGQAKPTLREAIHTPKTMNPEIADEDTVAGCRNWADQNKHIIDFCGELPQLYDWLDSNGGSWTKPANGSGLYRLYKCRDIFDEVKDFYQAKLAAISARKK